MLYILNHKTEIYLESGWFFSNSKFYRLTKRLCSVGNYIYIASFLPLLNSLFKHIQTFWNMFEQVWTCFYDAEPA